MTGSAFAGGGNSAAAAACQGGGWEALHRSDGTDFKNTGACVSYAARGGEFGSAASCTSGNNEVTCTGLAPNTPVIIVEFSHTVGSTDSDGFFYMGIIGFHCEKTMQVGEDDFVLTC